MDGHEDPPDRVDSPGPFINRQTQKCKCPFWCHLFVFDPEHSFEFVK